MVRDPVKSYIDQLKEDTMLKIEELPTAMNDRNEWKLRVMKCRASSTWKGKVYCILDLLTHI